MHTNPNVRASMDSAVVSTSTGAHPFHFTRGEKQAGGIAGIARDPAVWGGRAVIQGTRIPVFVIVDQFAESKDAGEVVREFPNLKPADVYLALAYAGVNEEEVARDRESYVEGVPSEARLG